MTVDTEPSAVRRQHYVARASIGGQCQEDFFNGDDGQVDGLLQMAEQDLSPALRDVCKNNSFNKQELNALSMMTVLLHMRLGRRWPRQSSSQR